jgi:hypothetical protein
MSADTQRLLFLADEAWVNAVDAADIATWCAPANTNDNPNDWLVYADKARDAAQAHDAARIAFCTAEQAARARAAALAADKTPTKRSDHVLLRQPDVPTSR